MSRAALEELRARAGARAAWPNIYAGQDVTKWVCMTIAPYGERMWFKVQNIKIPAPDPDRFVAGVSDAITAAKNRKP